MNALSSLLCLALGWYGAARTIAMWWKADHRVFIFTPWGAVAYVFASSAAFALYLLTQAAASAAGGPISSITEVLSIPVLVFPYALYGAGLSVELGRRFFSPESSVPPLHSYDKGDAAMARCEYAAAIACYREDLTRWPGDLEALLRLTRALAKNGQAELAAMELVALRLDLLKQGRVEGERPESAGAGAPGADRRERQDKLLVLTLALGDLYGGPLESVARERALYAEALQELYGVKGSDALRERLRRLDQPHVPQQAQDRIPLDE
jgi:hypothetical protein